MRRGRVLRRVRRRRRRRGPRAGRPRALPGRGRPDGGTREPRGPLPALEPVHRLHRPGRGRGRAGRCDGTFAGGLAGVQAGGAGRRDAHPGRRRAPRQPRGVRDAGRTRRQAPGTRSRRRADRRARRMGARPRPVDHLHHEGRVRQRPADGGTPRRVRSNRRRRHRRAGRDSHLGDAGPRWQLRRHGCRHRHGGFRRTLARH